MDWYFIVLICVAGAALIAFAFMAGISYRKKIGEEKIGSAEEEANRASLFKKPSSLGAPEMKDDTRAEENEKKANEKKTKEKKAPKSRYNQDPNRNNTSDGE